MQFSFLWKSGRKFQREFITCIQIAFDSNGPNEAEQCLGEIVFTGSVAEVRDNKQLREQYLAVWGFIRL